MKLIETQPGQPGIVNRLVELVRERDGNLAKLQGELEAQVAQGGDTAYGAALALATMARIEGRPEAALQALEQAHARDPQRPEALVAWADLLAERGKPKGARERLERALPLTGGVQRQAVLQKLRELSLDADDLEGARRYHERLMQDSRGNIYLRSELTRELLRRGRFEDAVVESRRVVQAAHGDRRALAPALRDQGQAELSAGKLEDAKQTLTQASRLSASDPGLMLQIDTLLAEAHEKAGTLETYLAELSAGAQSSGRLMLAAHLREKRGETAQAIEAYRRAAELAPRDPDPLLALVRLLELTSHLEEAAKYCETLTRIAPRQTDLSLRYVELLLAQGDRTRAIRELDRATRVASGDPDATLLLLDLAERLGEKQRADSLRRQAEARGRLEPHHLVELGSRAYRDGDRDRAFRLWDKITTVSGNPAKLQVVYGETLLGHEQLDQGIEALEKAARLAPDDPEIQRALARGYLRAAAQSTGSRKIKYELASLEQWTALLHVGGTHSGDEARRAEARRQVVRLYERTGQLDAQIASLHRRHLRQPADLEVGRLLALGQMQRSRLSEAEETLKRMAEAAPTDREALRMLDQVQMRQGKLEESIVTLTRLLELDPARAAQTYEELSRRALGLHRDDLALRYAELAAERDGGSSEGQARLGDLYVSQGSLKKAAAAYRAALAQDDRNTKVALSLANLLAKQGNQDESLRLLLKVLRTSRDSQELSQAGRAALTIGLAGGQARRLEDELRPLAISMPDQTIYQDLLLEVVTAEMTPKTWDLQFGTPAEKSAAETFLGALADRCLAPLLSALAKGDAGDQRRAIALLGFGKSESAGAALLEYAAGPAPEGLRVQAALAAARRTDARLVSRLRRLIATESVTYRGRLPRAALLGLAAISTPEARLAMKQALASDDPDLRVEALLALATSPQTLPTSELRAILSDPKEGPGPRAGAALALASRPAQDVVLQDLARATGEEHRLVRAASLHALARLDPGAERWTTLLSRALFDDDTELSKAALTALTAAGVEPSRGLASPGARGLTEEDLKVGGDQLIWARLIAEPLAEARVRALLDHQAAIQRSASLGLRTSKESALQVLGALRTTESTVSLLPLFDAQRDAEALPLESFAAAERACLEIRRALLPAILSHAGGSEAQTRAAALRTLNLKDGKGARLAILGALASNEPQVFEAALDALAKSPPELAIEQIGELLGQEQSWHRVRRIAELLERLALTEGGHSRRDARALLARISEETDGLARARALEALRAVDAQALGRP